MERMPHDRSDLLWSGSNPTKLLIDSVDRWVGVLVADDDFEQGSPAGGSKGEATIFSKDPGVLCGQFVVERVFSNHYSSCSAEWHIEEGGPIIEGSAILTIRGFYTEILRSERIIINILGRLSGISSNTANWVSAAGNIEVASTRKVGWGLLDKWAVHIGGGLTHRLHRGDALMLKENDIAAISVEGEESSETIERVVSGISEEEFSFITVEVSSLDEAVAAALAWGEDRSSRIVLMLDNMGPTKASVVVSSLSEEGLLDRCILEGSGRVDIKSLSEWEKCGVDLVSSSSLNLGVAPLDFSMLVRGVP